MALHRAAMPAAMQGVLPEALEAARSTLCGAAALAAQLPAPEETLVLDAAHRALARGVQISAAVGAVGALGLASFTAAMLRGARTGGHGESAATTAGAHDARGETAKAPQRAEVASIAAS